MMATADHTNDVTRNLTETLVMLRNGNTDLETSRSPKILVIVIGTESGEKSIGQEMTYV